MKIAIGADHAGYELKMRIAEQLTGEGHKVLNFGTDSAESVDYPDFAHPVAEAVATGGVEYGVVICGSGNGINMTVNKHQAVRSALCWNADVARLARQHNDANVLALPARFVSVEDALAIVKAFFSTAFEGGRHARRVGKISLLKGTH